MADSSATEASTRRRRAAGRSASLLPVNGQPEAAFLGSAPANVRGARGQAKRDRSLETAWSESKSEKKKRRRNDVGDGLRRVTTRHVVCGNFSAFGGR